MSNNFSRLFVFYILTIWFTKISGSILPAHVYEQGLTINQMILGNVFQFIAQIIILVFITKISSRKSWILSLLILAFSYIFLIKIGSLYQFYLSGIFAGIFLALYFVPYNIAHFKNTIQAKRGYSSGLMFAVNPFISIVAPIIAGLIALYNLNILWVVSAISLIIALAFASKQQNDKISYNVKKSIREIKATRVFIFIEGVWEAVIISIIPIYTLHFISTPLGYGKYLSYLALLGTGASLLVGKLTDKKQKRSIYLYPITIMLSLLTFLLTLALDNINLWFIITGLFQLLIPLFWNITTAMVVDKHKNLELAFPAREIVLGTGRLVGIALTFVGFTLDLHIPVLYILGLIMLLFPLVLYWNTKVSKKYSYL